MKKCKLTNDMGFTLLEVIIVLGIMSFFLMMTIPAAGRLEQTRRIINTRERLHLIREAILGQTPFDAQGRRQVDGFTGDLGTLPKLYPSEWDIAAEVWRWPQAPADETEFEFTFHLSFQDYLNRGFGQPKGLWSNVPVTGQPPLGVRWRGPYISEPMDEFFENHTNLLWNPFTTDVTQLNETREYEMRRTQGKLSDAWGRSLLFFYVDHLGSLSMRGLAGVTTVHIVSEGADMRSTIPAYDHDLPYNNDNIVLTITPREWADETRPFKTKQILDSVKEALTGSTDARDNRGRALTGGYVGDMGGWPKAFEWVQDVITEEWFWGESERVESAVALGTFYSEGVLRGLFTNEPGYDLNGHPIILPAQPNPVIGAAGIPVPLGFGWRGPYLREPGGFGGEQFIRDAWGTPLRFRFIYANQTAPHAHALTVTSAGADGIFDLDQASGIDYASDNISLTLRRSFDIPGNMILHGRLVNETGQDIIIGNDIGQVSVRLHASLKIDESPIWPSGTATSTVYGTPENIEIHGNQLDFDMPVDGGGFAGLRLIEIVERVDADRERRLAFSYVDLTDKAFFSPGSVSNDRVTLIIR